MLTFHNQNSRRVVFEVFNLWTKENRFGKGFPIGKYGGYRNFKILVIYMLIYQYLYFIKMVQENNKY